MPAPKKNQYWKKRSSHGRKPIFATPEELFAACCEYFEWVEKNPLYEMKVFSASEGIRKVKVPKMRAMTIWGLIVFLDISFNAWKQYCAREDFIQICERVETIIKDQKFAGAAADLLNASIIARELGLRDAQDVKHEGSITLSISSDDAELV